MLSRCQAGQIGSWGRTAGMSIRSAPRRQPAVPCLSPRPVPPPAPGVSRTLFLSNYEYYTATVAVRASGPMAPIEGDCDRRVRPSCNIPPLLYRLAFMFYHGTSGAAPQWLLYWGVPGCFLDAKVPGCCIGGGGGAG